MTAWFFFFSCTALTIVAVATLWSATQATVETGWSQIKHLFIVGFVIALLIALGFSAPPSLVQILGAGLVTVAIVLAFSEPWRYRVLCAVHCAFGTAVAAGLPLIAA